MEGSPEQFETSRLPGDPQEEPVTEDPKKAEFRHMREVLLGQRTDDSAKRLAELAEADAAKKAVRPIRRRQQHRVVEPPKKDWLTRWQEKHDQ